jgi:hypothetical protein
MSQDVMDELQFFPLVFNLDVCGFDIHGTLVARINRMYRGLPVSRWMPYFKSNLADTLVSVAKFKLREEQ